jgi:mannose-6-phosphate isomerase-like protein (cupin superfamily)
MRVSIVADREDAMRVINDAGRFTPPAGQDRNHWIEHLRVTDLSVGTYSVPRGGVDDQVPHTEDEIYVVISGRAVLRAGHEGVGEVGEAAVGPGSVIYVAAGEEHRFTDVTEDLAAVVLFAPAEGAREQAGGSQS